MAMPDPQTWLDGSDSAALPTAAALNAQWRDSFDYLLGNTRPMTVLEGSGGTTLTNGVWVPIPFTTNTVLRGGMAHSTVTNNTRVTVPETGRYRGIIKVGSTGNDAGGAGRWYLRVTRNGGSDHLDEVAPTPAPTVFFVVTWDFLVELTAGDYVQFELYNGHKGSPYPVTATDNKKPRLMMWLDTQDGV